MDQPSFYDRWTKHLQQICNRCKSYSNDKLIYVTIDTQPESICQQCYMNFYNRIQCRVCSQEFTSRNALFRHLETTKHFRDPPQHVNSPRQPKKHKTHHHDVSGPSTQDIMSVLSNIKIVE